MSIFLRRRRLLRAVVVLEVIWGCPANEHTFGISGDDVVAPRHEVLDEPGTVCEHLQARVIVEVNRDLDISLVRGMDDSFRYLERRDKPLGDTERLARARASFALMSAMMVLLSPAYSMQERRFLKAHYLSAEYLVWVLYYNYNIYPYRESLRNTDWE